MTRANFRVWLASAKETLGLPLAAVVAIALAALLFLVILPTTASEPTTGVVLSVGPISGKVRPASPATVRADGRLSTVRLRPNVDCQVGDRIALRRSKTRFGYAYGVGANPRPCSPP